MKAGILTFHRAANYGAVLQADALAEVLTQLGCDCELIDYRNPYIEQLYVPAQVKNAGSVRKSASAMLYGRTQSRKLDAFRAYVAARIPVSAETYTEENFARVPEHYDVVIAGSDQIWNLEITGEDYHYFLEFPNGACRKCSYAASLPARFGSEEQAARVKTDLMDFDAIAVREETGKACLESIGVRKEIDVTIDPTLLLEREDWEKKAARERRSGLPERYALIYFLYPTEEKYGQAQELSRRLGLPAVMVNDFFHHGKTGFTNVNDAAPEQFTRLFLDAAFVITDSFHGTSFPVNFGIDFVYLPNARHPEANGRILALLETLGLKGRADPAQAEAPVDNWDAVQERLAALRESALRFLTEKVLR